MKMKTQKGLVITVWVALGTAFILMFLIFSMILGGSAGNGYQESEKYFIGGHDGYIEVSRMIWMVSCVLEALFWIFIPLTPLGAFVIAKIQEKRERKKNRSE